eukprot:COSAG02_NODE_14789_length_1236_cov_1.343887_1_plen_65_part_00
MATVTSLTRGSFVLVVMISPLVFTALTRVFKKDSSVLTWIDRKIPFGYPIISYNAPTGRPPTAL